MNYHVKMIGGQTFIVGEKDYIGILKGDGLIVLKDLGITISKSSISSIFPENLAKEDETKKPLTFGVLHDGTKVRKHFGEWVDATFTAVDDNGRIAPVRFDLSYYPEIAKDSVFSVEEYEKIKHLPKDNKKQILLGKQSDNRQIGFTKIQNLLSQQDVSRETI